LNPWVGRGSQFKKLKWWFKIQNGQLWVIRLNLYISIKTDMTKCSKYKEILKRSKKEM
jgi:hypothetical protein